MKQPLSASLLLLGLSSLLVGCAFTAHVRGVAGEEAPGAIPDGALICVAVDPEAAEIKQSRELTRKLEELLSRKGYSPTNSSDAEYFLFYALGSKPLMTRVGLRPLTGIRTGIKTYEKEGPYDLTLSLRLVEASSYHEKGLDEFVWAGAAIINGTPTQSTKFDDLLLVAAMKYFPLDTEAVRKVKIGLYDFRARRLRRSH
jgi:hypothetical protein